HLALAVGEADHVFTAAQLAAREVEYERTEAHRFGGRRARRPDTTQDAGNAQRQFARLEWFRQIIVGAYFQALDSAFLLVARREHKDRHRRSGADRAGEI